MNKMQVWEIHELECVDYLQRRYGKDNRIRFELVGGSDSTQSDIKVYKENVLSFFIEAKMSSAQSGQFVLFSDENQRRFVFSSANKSDCNEYVCDIINELNKNFDKYKQPSSKLLDMDVRLFANWITNHYRTLNVKFVITKNKNKFVIVPIEKFGEYFDIKAIYRVKKSGSANPSKQDCEEIKSLLEENNIKISNLYFEGKYLLVEVLDCIKSKFILKGEKKDFYFRERNLSIYKVTKLSNTFNANVIFSISLKKEQGIDDLILFRRSLDEK